MLQCMPHRIVSAPLDEQVGDVSPVDGLIFSQTKDSFLMLNKNEAVVSEVGWSERDCGVFAPSPIDIPSVVMMSRRQNLFLHF